MKKLSFPLLTVIFLGILLSTSVEASERSAVLLFSPLESKISQGDIATVDIIVDSQSEYINVVSAHILYPSDKLELLDINTTNTSLSFFAEKIASQESIIFTGGTPTPGIKGKSNIATLMFKVRSVSGTAALTFAKDSAVLTNFDNTDILDINSSEQGIFTITPAITSATDSQNIQDANLQQASIFTSFVNFLKSIFG